MGGSRHLIGRQTIEIVAADAGAAEALGARTSAAAPALGAAIERVLDAYDVPGQRLRLDVVEIDLGILAPERWEEALVTGVARELARRLPLELPAVEPVAPAEAALRLLAEFLQSGRLPWWGNVSETPAAAIATLATAAAPSGGIAAALAAPGAVERAALQFDETTLALLARLAEPRLGDDVAGAVAALVGRDRSAAGRARVWRAVLRDAGGAHQAGAGLAAGTANASVAVGGGALPKGWRWPGPPGFWAGVTVALGLAGDSVLGGAPLDAVRNARTAAGRAAAASAPGRRGATDVAASDGPDVNAGAETGEAAADAVDRLAALLTRLGTADGPAAGLLGHLASRAGALGADTAAVVTAELRQGPSPAAVIAVVKAFAAADAVSAGDAKRWLAALDDAASRAARAARTAAEAPHDAIMVANAGLPLLWPFLPAYYTNAGLLAENAFVDAAAQHRAAGLLHLLASGEVLPPETQLPLCKLLAGLDIDALHDPGEPFGAGEIAGAAALLEAAIGHAPMLGRISIDGLRSAWLMRPGVLTTRDGLWLLRVERQGYDVLLDRLPWGFDWVRLPWMAAPVRVEW